MKFRLALSAFLALAILVTGAIGVVYAPIVYLQILCAVIALCGAISFQYLWHHLIQPNKRRP